jgi:hypothetical protein
MKGFATFLTMLCLCLSGCVSSDPGYLQYEKEMRELQNLPIKNNKLENNLDPLNTKNKIFVSVVLIGYFPVAVLYTVAGTAVVIPIAIISSARSVI